MKDNCYIGREYLITEFKSFNKSPYQIAKQLKCSIWMVKKFLKIYGISRTSSETLIVRRKGKYHPSYKGDKAITRQIYYCKELDCTNKISYGNWKCGSGLCSSCACKFSIKKRKKSNKKLKI